MLLSIGIHLYTISKIYENYDSSQNWEVLKKLFNIYIKSLFVIFIFVISVIFVIWMISLLFTLIGKVLKYITSIKKIGKFFNLNNNFEEAKEWARENDDYIVSLNPIFFNLQKKKNGYDVWDERKKSNHFNNFLLS